MTPRRIGVIGLGAISRYYLAAIDRLPGWTLAAVCDPREAALTPHRGHVPCHTGHQALLAEPGLDAVVVAVPNHAHAAICRDALRAGLPVCVEKPLALHAGEGRELTALARAHATPLFTAFHRRYNDEVRRLQRDVAAARAPIASLKVRYLERIEEHIGGDTWYLDPERCGGGCVADNGPNAFDLVRQFLGDVEVSEASITRDAQGTDRQAVIGLRAADGRTATVELDWSYPGEAKDIEVRLRDGTVRHADMLARHPGFKASLWHEYTGILDDFAAARPPGADDTDDGLAALELVAASYRTEHVVTTDRGDQ
ncbi:Gfo/Idh/MocA family protein [Streptomyces ochraceiscleroticus]|uniref:Gfo/Idh/MocA family protein n=1 Tax=Streptomyces ochraceiscleroticus TaxID=47761 RepID=A0ABW1MI45_9ACTN|nr:Gfo/Idh/MocA family oxidoreductase [Streptomyces ochraceiscleroticus]